MTLTEYEAGLLVLASDARTRAAGPAWSLREQLSRGEPFVASRDRVAGQSWQAKALDYAGQLQNFQALTGP